MDKIKDSFFDKRIGTIEIANKHMEMGILREEKEDINTHELMFSLNIISRRILAYILNYDNSMPVDGTHIN